MDPSDAIEGEDDLSDLYSESPVPSSSTQPSLKRKATPSQDSLSSKRYRPLVTPSQASVTTLSPFGSRASSRQTGGFLPHSGSFSRPCSISQPPKNAHEAESARHLRCEEIQRRCTHLEEPIPLHVLQTLDSYYAASKISAPLTEDAWSVLLPRLLLERASLLRRTNQAAEASQNVSPLGGDKVYNETGPTAKEIKAAAAAEWDHSQKSVRDRLAQCADAVIAQSWSDPLALNFDTCPRFAVNVLLCARQSYITAAIAEGFDSNLLMDNMRWLYDHKVKPLISQHGRDVFLCNGCNTKARFYSFDSVVQHYAAKHTDVLSSGNIVVAWQQKTWPSEPPFAPDPDSHWVQQSRRIDTPGHHGPYPSASPVVLTASPPQGPVIAAPFPVQPFRSLGTGFPGTLPQGHVFGGPTSPFDSQRPFFIAPTSPLVYGGYRASPFLSSSPTALSTSGQSISSASSFYHSQLAAVATVAHQIWSSISHVKSIPPSVRMFTIIVHVISSFRDRFSNEPSLELFADAVISQPSMVPMKDVTGLSCAVCVSEQQQRAASLSQPVHKKMFLFHSLLSHFKTVHVQTVRAATQPDSVETSSSELRPNWKKDMVDLPRTQVVKDLIRAPNMTQAALDVLAVAFPEALGSPLDIHDSRRPTFVDSTDMHNFQPHAHSQLCLAPSNRHVQGRPHAYVDASSQSHIGQGSPIEIEGDSGFDRTFERPVARDQYSPPHAKITSNAIAMNQNAAPQGSFGQGSIGQHHPTYVANQRGMAPTSGYHYSRDVHGTQGSSSWPVPPIRYVASEPQRYSAEDPTAFVYMRRSDYERQY